MAKIKNILLWIVLAVYFIAILGFVAETRKHVICNKIEIDISDSDMNKFLQKGDVNRALAKYKTHVIGMPIDSVNTFLAEKVIGINPAIKECAAYTTAEGSLCIKVEQRKPILRVVNNKYQNYFIDETGQIIPQINQYASYTLVANGNINEPFVVSGSRNIFPSKKDTILRPNIIYDLYYLASFIKNDDFWNAQIEQIYVDSRNDMQLIPRVGSHVIIFGRADNMAIKFKKLKSIYRAFNEIGWNKYKTINLKYNNQVICTKR
jgi:cell division protein FtsQ